ncbi:MULTISPECIES: ABC transporter substrate-binding protein [Alteromonadaceae]|uniref:ABC transporter substrate-binding protein n=1 Tax=Alteromonadaceae TaxID=72275 RepID=UPI001C083C54|nr:MULTISPECIES: ABC transporter substrate-binding protein [Aliiglaciecola]MBU2879461.1 ABC transporter substrate-binding protein [Aliiglaciecola lipolytica]MDO6712503.1 ABC transporter substrate-binding protein [Aliiglaciecola sp. 2_MG-2023]MDO6753439.1 ABC transporter substrate-binding protein [Aliiglaciecola sp. 1_MG-2023]
MRNRFLIKIASIALLTIGLNAHGQTIDETNPYSMVKDVASQTFDRIKREKQKISEDPEVLRVIMKEELLPHVDYKFSAFKVLGKYVTKAEKAQLQEFVAVFREYLVTTYAVAMGYYDDQTVEFEPESDFEDERSVTVRAIVKDGKRPDIKIAFKVRKDRKTNEWKAYDMVAEGISMLSSKQSEFESILRQQGIDKVIELMREKIEQPISLEKKEA